MSDGNTPLHISLETDFGVMAKYLVETATADITLKNKSGDTPLKLAESKNDPDLLRVFKVSASRK
jgi:ankyrin repeat protein